MTSRNHLARGVTFWRNARWHWLRWCRRYLGDGLLNAEASEGRHILLAVNNSHERFCPETARFSPYLQESANCRCTPPCIQSARLCEPFTGTGTFVARLLQLGVIPPEALELGLCASC